jgi:cardiolipin synthase
MQAIQEAQHHIHIEYYIFRSDDIGTKLLKLLIEKAKQGVEVRLIYDDFGSPNIDQKLKKQLQDAGAAVFPFYEIKFYLLANRYNYRNHRKLVVIDGSTACVGGINVADEYINDQDSATYWRDTHLLIKGPAIYYLQYLFMTDWKFCCPDEIKVNTNYFKEFSCSGKGSTVQIAASGPDSAQPAILYSLLQAMYLAKKEILITTPYFVPGDSFMDALCAAALSALKVKLLVPKKTDSKLTDAASNSFFAQLLEAGAEVYLYKKGLLHSKTIVIDSSIGIIGTANMDHRSFELNFEVNAIVYDEAVAKEMRETFFLDLESADQINKEAWLKRPWNRRLPEKIARLFSPVL